MDKTRKTWGLRHLALRVRDVQVSQSFYEQVFGMKVVWHPDEENVYLSTGLDNLALHQYPKEDVSRLGPAHLHPLDHMGFLMASPEDVENFYKEISQQNVTIVKPLARPTYCLASMESQIINRACLRFEEILPAGGTNRAPNGVAPSVRTKFEWYCCRDRPNRMKNCHPGV